jgi:hypothetical protein
MITKAQHNLQKRYALIKMQESDFGTVLRQHTLGEVKEIIALNDWRIQILNKAVDRIIARGVPTIQQQKLIQDWKTFMIRWNEAKQSAELSIKTVDATSPIPVDYYPAEKDFQNVLNAISKTYPSYTDTDLGGLHHRIETIESINWKQEQPRPESHVFDVDHEGYILSDKVIKKGQEQVEDHIKYNLIPAALVMILSLVFLKRIGII